MQMFTYSLTHTHTHSTFLWKKSAEAKGFYEQVSSTEYSPTEILKLKRITTLSKQPSL